MNKLAGRLPMATAVGHALVGLVLFHESIAAILDDGFVNAIQPPLYAAEPRFDRIAAFWFLLFGPVLFLFGQITNWAVEQGDVHSLKPVGWNLMGIGIFGSIVLPISGQDTHRSRCDRPQGGGRREKAGGLTRRRTRRRVASSY